MQVSSGFRKVCFVLPFLSVAFAGSVSLFAAPPDECETDKAKAADVKPAVKKAADKKSQEAMQKAVENAREAYEKEKRDRQERLKADPLWHPSHEQATVIKMEKEYKDREINSFCRDAEGNLLVCLSGRQRGAVETLLGGKTPVQRGTIVKVSPEGKKLGEWKIEIEPQAICRAEDGTVFVGGSGKLCKLDREGKVLCTVDSAAMVGLPPLPEIKKEPKPTGPEAEAAEKAKKEQIAELREKLKKVMAEYQKLAAEAGKDLKANDEAAMEAFQAKVRGPLEQLQSLQSKLMELSTTPEQRAMQERMRREHLTTITGIAISERDLFFVCASAKGYGYDVWRTDHAMTHPKKVVEHLAGCCGQMDVQSSGGDLWIAHNARHKVEHYNRDGKKLGSFGKTDRSSADGFGGCCEPKNLRFAGGEDLFASESGPPTCVKRFTKEGKFLGVALIAPWNSGCVRVTTEYDAAKDRFFVLNSGEKAIHVFLRKEAEKKPPETASLKVDPAVN